jgi:hypothetical protein
MHLVSNDQSEAVTDDNQLPTPILITFLLLGFPKDK